MASVLVAGNGFLGEVVARRLVEQGRVGCGSAGLGAEIIAVSRTARPVPPGVRALLGDLRSSEFVRSLPALSHVIFCAGADEHREDAYRAIYVEALGYLIDSLQARSEALPRFLFVSSTTVYEHSSGEWVDETTETAPRRFPGRVMLEAEAMLTSRVPRSIVLRCGGIYGKGRTQLIDSVRNGTATYALGGPVYTNRIHKEDCAAAIVELLSARDASGVYIACDSHPAERREVLEWLARVLGVPAPHGSRDAAAGRGGNKRCRNTRLLAMGYRLMFPSFREGYAHDLGLPPPRPTD